MSIRAPELPSDEHPSEGTQNPKAEAKAAKAYAKATRPWYKKKRWWATGLLLIIIWARSRFSPRI